MLHTVIRLGELARDRRFQRWVTTQQTETPSEQQLQQLKLEWQDEPTEAQKKQYENLKSYWDLRQAEHGRGLCKVVHGWVLEENLSRGEVEARLHFCHLQGGSEPAAVDLS